MVNAWSLLYEEMNGTMDETYPIREDIPDNLWGKPIVGGGNTASSIFESPDGGKTVYQRPVGGGQRVNVNPQEEWERVEKPQPDLDRSSHRKYEEDKSMRDLTDYVSSTYQGHYTNQGSNVQTLDLIHSVGDAESFCRSNAIKYLSRYDKKGQAKRDILKAMHYCLLLYYFSGNANDEITTRGYETF